MKKLTSILFIILISTSIFVSALTITTATAFKSPPPVNDGEWAMFHHDLAHTGTSASTAPNTNNVLWSQLVSNTGGAIWSNPAVVNGKVYVGSADNIMYCFDAFSGDYIWSYTTEDKIYNSPAVADGKVYIGSYDNNIYCLDAASGGFMWSFTTGNEVYCSPSVAGGKVYVGSSDQRLYCFGNPVVNSVIVRIEPKTISLKSYGVITAFIQLSDQYDVRNIDISTVRCQGAIATRGTVAGDTLIVKFDRESIQGLTPEQTITLTVTGQLKDTSTFSGQATVRIIE